MIVSHWTFRIFPFHILFCTQFTIVKIDTHTHEKQSISPETSILDSSSIDVWYINVVELMETFQTRIFYMHSYHSYNHFVFVVIAFDFVCVCVQAKYEQIELTMSIFQPKPPTTSRSKWSKSRWHPKNERCHHSDIEEGHVCTRHEKSHSHDHRCPNWHPIGSFPHRAKSQRGRNKKTQPKYNNRNSGYHAIGLNSS